MACRAAVCKPGPYVQALGHSSCRCTSQCLVGCRSLPFAIREDARTERTLPEEWKCRRQYICTFPSLAVDWHCIPFSSWGAPTEELQLHALPACDSILDGQLA
eukprot:scaffold684_cov345-Pavlova_lutheri.AAC.8